MTAPKIKKEIALGQPKKPRKARRKKKSAADDCYDKSGLLRLKKDDLYELEMARMKKSEAVNSFDLLEYRHRDFIQKMRVDVETLKIAIADRSQKLDTIETKISETYCVDFSQCSYDDKTGRIHKHGSRLGV